MNAREGWIVSAFLVLALIAGGVAKINSVVHGGCVRDNTLRSSLRQGVGRTYVLRVTQANGNAREIDLAIAARNASLKAYAAHGC